MKLIDRYLHAVRFFLPRSQQGPAAELAEDLQSQIEDKETDLGRALSDDEVSDILKKCGHPLLVAGRLAPEDYLIGPPWFPIYLFALKALILWILVPGFFIAALGWAVISDQHSQAFMAVFGHLWGAVVTAIGWVTVLFIAAERIQRRCGVLNTWNPATLPEFQPKQRISRPSSVIEIVVYLLFLLWWMDFVSTPMPHGSFFALAPVWRELYWPILAVVVAHIAFSFSCLLNPWWTRGQRLFRLGLNFASLAIVGFLIKAGTWVVLRLPDMPEARVESISRNIDTGFQVGLLITAAITIYEIVTDLRKLAESRS